MRLLVDSLEAAGRRTVELSIDAPGARVTDLAVALELPPSALTIDGSVRLGDTLLEDISLTEGSRVAPVGPSYAARSGIGRSWIGVSAGGEAGSVRRLESHGAVTIGRSEHSDLPIANSSVSDLHAVVERTDDGMTIEDLGSTNGTWVEGRSITRKTRLNAGAEARVGSSSIRFKVVDADDKPLATSAEHVDESGRILFNRPPRSPVAEPPATIELPDALPARQNPKLAIAAIAVPLLIAGVMVVALGSWRFALFALLSPLMALATWLSGRRAVRHATAGDVASRREAIQLLKTKVANAEEKERQRRSEFGPDLLEIRRRVELPSSRLWERRLSAADALAFRLGRGSTDWNPFGAQLDELVETDESIQEILSGAEQLDHVEILADVASGPVGFVGDTRVVTAGVRSALLQLATHHGPADMTIAILTEEGRASSWGWAQWLPHMRNALGGVNIVSGSAGREFAASLDRQLDTDDSARTPRKLSPGVLLVVDDLQLLHERDSSVRSLLERSGQNVFGIVIAEVADQLPASVHTIVEVDASDGEFSKSEPARPGHVERGLIDAVSAKTADDIARAMAKFEDPEFPLVAGALPSSVAADEVMGAELFDPVLAVDHLIDVWNTNASDSSLVAPIGVSDGGVLTIDLVNDGPHGLVAGTTGSGKSEFLRSMIVGLACNYSPDELVFVLVDYKGGSAFDRCAHLPHVAGLVTDLDEHLASRALESLEAELRFRESLLRDANADSIDEYRLADSPSGALPRLVVVIDEFATMRAELDGFVGSLVGIAQRGRSLGVHLILATQRPAGAVDANIAANTNLRVALRVQSSGESVDVVGDAQASKIPRHLAGRGVVRRGDEDLVTVQTAFVSGLVSGEMAPLRVGEVAPGPAGPVFAVERAGSGKSQLDQLVEVCSKAATDYDWVRRPWLPDLPRWIAELSTVEAVDTADDAHVALAIADDPSNQRQLVVGWNLDDGHLGVIGRAGSGVTTTLRSAVIALGGENEHPVWVFPVDHGAGGFAGIDRFDHVASVIASSDNERQERLLQFLSGIFDERRAGPMLEDQPIIVVAIDGIGSFCEANNVDPGSPNAELIKRLGRDGPSVGIYLLIGAASRSELPRDLRQAVTSLIVLEQADDRGYLDLGISTKALPSFVPGRCLMGAQNLVSQIIDWEPMVNVGEIKLRSDGEPPEISPLPTSIPMADLPDATLGVDISIPIGISDATRDAANLVIRSSEHVLIAGPSRSGRSNALRLIGAQLRRIDDDLVLVGISPANAIETFPSHIFDAGGTLQELDAVLQLALDEDPTGQRWVIVVDDADRIDLDGGPLHDLVRSPQPNVTVIAAIRSSFARQTLGHWTRSIRASGTGILLEPDPTSDGDLFGVRLPRRRLPAVPGRGYLIAGGEEMVIQVAAADDSVPSATAFTPIDGEEE